MPVDTRERILAAAMELFGFQGTGNTGLAQIADKAGVERVAEQRRKKA